MNNQYFDIENGQIYFYELISSPIEEESKPAQTLDFESTLLPFDLSEGFVEEKVSDSASCSQKKKRNNQNHVRTLNRKLKKITHGTYKIHQIGDNEDDKKFMLAVCHLSSPLQLEEIKKELSKLYSYQGNSSKDKKLLAHVNFILNLQPEDFIDENMEITLNRLAETGQIKKHPIKDEKYSLERYWVVCEKLKQYL